MILVSDHTYPPHNVKRKISFKYFILLMYIFQCEYFYLQHPRNEQFKQRGTFCANTFQCFKERFENGYIIYDT
jgi:hypothetical protein